MESPVPTEPSPITPEGEPKPQGFQVRVEKPDLIFKAAKDGKSGELGKQFLSSPLNSVEVTLESNKEDFNLVGRIRTGYGLGTNELVPEGNYYQTLQAILPTLLQSHPEAEKFGGRYVFKGSKGKKFILDIHVDHQGTDLDIDITTGTIEETLREEQIIPAPKCTQDVFEDTLSDFSEVLEVLVTDLYRFADKDVPKNGLTIRPPKEGMVAGGRGSIFKKLFGGIQDKELLEKIQIEKPNVTFEDIGGQPVAKREIQGIAFALKNPELYQKWGTKPPKGVILYGPPGTGKTLMAKALASQAEARFFSVKVSDIASKWYGESEQIVQSIFDLVKKGEEKTIIFFDEMDSIGMSRSGAHEVTQKITSMILQNMDGMSASDKVMVVAATNRLDDMEPALLRAGRFDRWVQVCLPDEEERKQIFDIHMRKTETVAGRSLFEDINVEALIAKTNGLNGADIAEIIRRTLEEKVRQEGTTGQDPGSVTTEDILKQLGEYEKVKKNETRRLGFATPNEG